MDRKLAIVLAATISVSLLVAGCATKDQLITSDRNGDGKPDLWAHQRSGQTYVTESDYDYNGHPENWFYWNEKGALIKKVSLLEDGKKTTVYYTDPVAVQYEGRPGWRTATDMKRSYPSAPPATYGYIGQSFVTAANAELMEINHDDNYDGHIDRVTKFKNFIPQKQQP